MTNIISFNFRRDPNPGTDLVLFYYSIDININDTIVQNIPVTNGSLLRTGNIPITNYIISIQGTNLTMRIPQFSVIVNQTLPTTLTSTTYYGSIQTQVTRITITVT